MALTLYRKYRPQTFKEVIGQNHIKTTIQSELETGKIAHAYLFSGPRGLGKTTMARLLAKAVNCLKRKEGESEPCNSCESCQEVINGRSLDVIEIDAASHTGVDNVRENIINNSRFTPTSRKFKVFIIDEVHMLSISAFNALLKTLEEPPAHAIFILATTEIHKVPQTIISRCQHFEFRKVANQDIIQRLSQIVSREEKKIDQSVLENVAYYGQGCIRDAESLLGQILSLNDQKITAEQAELVLPRSRFDLALELVGYLIKSDSAQAIFLVNRLVEEGINLEKFTAELIEILRKIMLIKVSDQLGQFTGTFNQDLEKKVIDFSKTIALDFLLKVVEILVVRRQELKFADIPQLPLELAILEIIGDQAKLSSQEKPDKIDQAPKPPPAQSNQIETEVKKTRLNPIKKPASKSQLNLEQVTERWHEVLVSIKQYNQSLASTLKICQPSVVKADGTLEISLQHQFHQQRINDSKNRQILEKVLAEVFGVPLLVKTIVVKNLSARDNMVASKEKNEVNESLDNVLKTFGGQVID